MTPSFPRDGVSGKPGWIQTPSLVATWVRVRRIVRVNSSASHLNPGTTARAPRLAAIANAKVSITSVPVHWWARRRSATDHQLSGSMRREIHPFQAFVVNAGHEIHEAGVRAPRSARRRSRRGLEPVRDQEMVLQRENCLGGS